MKKFWNLFNFEYNRFANSLFPGMLVAFAIEFAALFFLASSYKNELGKIAIQHPNWGTDQILAQMNGPFSMSSLISSPLFAYPFMAIVMIFVVYGFYTWYREWLGKNTFIYRLLMLPMSRMQLYFSKGLVFIVGGLTALMSQFLILFGFEKFAEWMVSPEFMDPVPFYLYMTSNWTITGVFYSKDTLDLVQLIGGAVAALSILFAAILLERSFKFKGLIPGIIMVVLYIYMISTILSVDHFYSLFNVYLLPSEKTKLVMITNAVWFVVTLFINRYLLNKKVTV